MSQPSDRPLQRTRLESANLAAAWEEHADEFIAWARKPGHDGYWRFHRDQFLELLPPPGHRTLDLGCGDGRLARDLKSIGHSALCEAGLVLERLREPNVPDSAVDDARSRRWQRIPLFLHIRALELR